MTNQEILKNISNIAFKKGCRNYLVYHFKDKDLKDSLDWEDYYGLIFSHEFAKVFFGNECYECMDCKHIDIDPGQCSKCDNIYDNGQWRRIIEGWEYHLQKMVVQPEPLKYLERFL